VCKLHPVECRNDTRWSRGLLSTQAKVESIVLKAARHWGIDSSVVYIPLGEPRRTSLYVFFRLRGAPWP
jgi:hypothetical protein